MAYRGTTVTYEYYHPPPRVFNVLQNSPFYLLPNYNNFVSKNIWVKNFWAKKIWSKRFGSDFIFHPEREVYLDDIVDTKIHSDTQLGINKNSSTILRLH